MADIDVKDSSGCPVGEVLKVGKKLVFSGIAMAALRLHAFGLLAVVTALVSTDTILFATPSQTCQP
jgi:hypothetical protein